MVVWNPPDRDYEFLFNEVFDAIHSIEGLGFDDFDKESLSMMIEGWGTHTREVWLPINKISLHGEKRKSAIISNRPVKNRNTNNPRNKKTFFFRSLYI